MDPVRRTDESGAESLTYVLKSGSHYGVKLHNASNVLVRAVLEIDQVMVGNFLLDPRMDYEAIQRPASSAQKFTFYTIRVVRKAQVEVSQNDPETDILSAGMRNVARSDIHRDSSIDDERNGLVMCTFSPVKTIPVRFEDGSCHWVPFEVTETLAAFSRRVFHCDPDNHLLRILYGNGNIRSFLSSASWTLGCIGLDENCSVMFQRSGFIGLGENCKVSFTPLPCYSASSGGDETDDDDDGLELFAGDGYVFEDADEFSPSMTPECPISVKVAFTDRTTLDLAISSLTSVLALKSKIWHERSVPIKQQRLFLLNALLEDTKTLQSYGIGSGDTVYCDTTIQGATTLQGESLQTFLKLTVPWEFDSTKAVVRYARLVGMEESNPEYLPDTTTPLRSVCPPAAPV